MDKNEGINVMALVVAIVGMLALVAMFIGGIYILQQVVNFLITYLK